MQRKPSVADVLDLYEVKMSKGHGVVALRVGWVQYEGCTRWYTKIREGSSREIQEGQRSPQLLGGCF